MEFSLVRHPIRPQKGRPLRPVRNRKMNRRIFDIDRRPTKRLFTPEIKKYLKDWLVRRRDNPYPTRDEKKTLAYETGLTYIQVCNWFANWRRKLKNAGKEPQRSTWANLIKTYNSQAKGNVEHFSICSDDSIWEEGEMFDDVREYDRKPEFAIYDHYYTTGNKPETDDPNNNGQYCENKNLFHNKYKNQIMEKYLRDIDNKYDAPLLTKWLESAANFQPSDKNFINWNYKRAGPVKHDEDNARCHMRAEELAAAEALTKLANASIA